MFWQPLSEGVCCNPWQRYKDFLNYRHNSGKNYVSYRNKNKLIRLTFGLSLQVLLVSPTSLHPRFPLCLEVD